ncbi:PREDICTED: uncharacterized protein LOC104813552 isoform X2 [Tarenaya hassleriana]|uniref:uncharacterized protein LOC104813552 isoform X2 n=1 Tax=Tarenaya hassleriana TaxID=28532 RepID=UPI00053C40B1|nr:PREDICTED: uncharacterized protein LOC104813552 isoform X2 [Tarenaya hassleriana]
MAFSLRSNPCTILSLNPLPKRSAISRSFLYVRCGPRDNRGPLVKGRILSTEAIHAIQSLKRAHRSGSLPHTLPPLRRLLKADLLAVLRELLRQDHCSLSVHVLFTLRSEYPPLDLTLYADVVNALSRNGLRDEIDRLIGELDGIDGGYDADKPLVKLLKAVTGAGRRESTVRIYTMMKNAGWGSAAWEADEYVTEVLSKGLRRLGEEELSDEVAKKRIVPHAFDPTTST